MVGYPPIIPSEVKMNSSVRHIALFVPDLRSAERYYRSIFDMELVGRETELAERQWYTLPFDKGWGEAEAAGIELGMVFLRKGDFGLGLFRGIGPAGQIYLIGLKMPIEEIAKVRARLPGIRKSVKIDLIALNSAIHT